MAKTLVEKVKSPNPDVSIFKISGTLGYHENEVILRFFERCSNKNITRLVMDLSSLESLGGGCAKIMREQVAAGGIVICMAGASRMVHDFLSRGDSQIHFEAEVESAVSRVATLNIPQTSPEEEEVIQEAVKLGPLGNIEGDVLVGLETDPVMPTSAPEPILAHRHRC